MSEIRVTRDPVTDKTHLQIDLEVDFDHDKLLNADASYADMIFAEIKHSWDAAWAELLTSVMASKVV